MHTVSAAIAAFFIGFVPTVASAAWISITNAGFELPGAVDGQFQLSVGPGWVRSELQSSYDAGVMNPTPLRFPAEAPEGNNVLNMARGARIDQVLSDVLTPGDYTLTMQVGRSLLEPMSPFIIQFLGGGISLVQTSSASPAPGTFTLVTLNYSATGSDPNLGSALAIRIDLTGDSNGQPQFFGDDIQLEYLVPEPGSLALAAVGLVGSFFCYRRHKRR
jgi:hypothetical protein